MNRQNEQDNTLLKSLKTLLDKALSYPENYPQVANFEIFLSRIVMFVFSKKLIPNFPTRFLKKFDNVGIYFKKIIHLSTPYTYTNSVYLYII